MISTKSYHTLPHRNKLKDICKGISVIDAILSENWLDRYYTYNSKWAENEEFSGMRNGQGDELLILFKQHGCVINGMAHEYYPKDKSKLTLGMPKIYEEFIFGEPVHSIGTTFCIWTNSDDAWQIGQPENLVDGSEEMLQIFDGNPETYIKWATDYYEDLFVTNQNTFNVISSIYQGDFLTRSMVLSINKQITHWQQLQKDLTEINYSNSIL